MNAAKIRKEWEFSTDFPFEFSPFTLLFWDLKSKLACSCSTWWSRGYRRLFERTQEKINVNFGKFDYYSMNGFASKASLGDKHLDYNESSIPAWRMVPRTLCFLSFSRPRVVFCISFERWKDALSFNTEIQILQHTNEWQLNFEMITVGNSPSVWGKSIGDKERIRCIS